MVFLPVLLFGRMFSIRVRILFSYSLDLILVLATPLFPLLIPSAAAAYWMTCASLFVLGMVSGVLNASVLGLAALFPPAYTKAALVGTYEEVTASQCNCVDSRVSAFSLSVENVQVRVSLEPLSLFSE